MSWSPLRCNAFSAKSVAPFHLASTLHLQRTTGSQPEEVWQKSETFSVLASPSKHRQPQTGAFQLSQAYFPRRSASSPLSLEPQPRLAMNNVLDASDRCTSPRWTRFLSPSLPPAPFSFCTAGPANDCHLSAGGIMQGWMDPVDEWSQRH